MSCSTELAAINPTEEVTVVVEHLELEAETDHHFTPAFFFQYLTTLTSEALNLSVTKIRGLIESMGRLWANNYPLEVNVEEIIPKSTLTFIISGLFAFAEIKSQGQAGFPFQTHTQIVTASVTSLLMYGLSSAAELVISGARFNPSSVYAVIARFGRITSLCVLVISLSSLFYF